MASLAIFIDGGYLDKLGVEEFHLRVDLQKLADLILRTVQSKTPEPVDLLRAYYYNCLPYQSDPPTEAEKQRFAASRRFFETIRHISRFTVREGRLVFRGMNTKGEPIFQQKRVDLQLGLDFALLSGKQRVTHVAVVSGDSDLIPAFEVAKDEGVSVWLFHGPKSRKNQPEQSTYAQDLWVAADERFELTEEVMRSVARPKRIT